MCPFLGLGIFSSYLCDLYFIFSLIFMIINHITSLKWTHLFFVHLLEYLLLLLDDNVNKKSQYFSNSKSLASGCCLASAWFFASFSLVLLIKKRVFYLPLINANYLLYCGRSQRDACDHSPPQVSTTFDTTLMEVVFPWAFQQFQLSL